MSLSGKTPAPGEQDRRSNVERLETFINRLLAQKFAGRLELHHSSGVKGGPAVMAEDFTGVDVDSNGMAKAFVQAAKDDAGAHPGEQSYQLRAYHEEDDGKTVACTIRVKGGEGIAVGDGSNVATIAHLLRSIEAKDRTIAGMVEHTRTLVKDIRDAYQPLLAYQGAQIEALSKRHGEVLDMQEKLVTALTDRKLDEQKQAAAEERKKAGFEKLMMVLPAVVNKVTGRNILPDNSAFASLKQLFDTLTEDQQMTVMTALTEEQRVLLGSLLEKLDKKELPR
jgi:hypothetical protein